MAISFVYLSGRLKRSQPTLNLHLTLGVSGIFLFYSKNILNEFCKFTLFRLVNIVKHSLFVSDFVVFLHIGALGVCKSEQLQFLVPFIARPSVGANYDNDNTYANSIKCAISDIIFDLFFCQLQ